MQLDPTNPYQGFILTDGEEVEGTVLTILQTAVMKNRLAAAMNELAVTHYDTGHSTERFIQEQAILLGRKQELELILAESEAVDPNFDADDPENQAKDVED